MCNLRNKTESFYCEINFFNSCNASFIILELNFINVSRKYNQFVCEEWKKISGIFNKTLPI